MKQFLFITLLMIISFSCKKNETVKPIDLLDPNGLPPCTTIGAETMGCLVNGVPWLPQKPAMFGGGNVYDITWELTGDGGLNINGLRQFVDLNIEDFLHIAGPDFTSTGIYTENLSCSMFLDENAYDYESVSSNFSTVEILKMDFENGILSGKFEFDLTNVNDSTDTLQIRQGRFDLLSN